MMLTSNTEARGMTAREMRAAYQAGPRGSIFCGCRRPTSGAAPMRRIGALVARQRSDAREPAPERRIVHFHGHEARRQLRSLRLLERTLHKLDARKDHHVDR